MVEALTVDIHRLGSLGPGGVLRADDPYVTLTGSSQPPRQRSVGLSHDDLLHNLCALRYPGGPSAVSEQDALAALGAAAAAILPLDELGDATPLQLDLVLSAEELWALPFEACVGEEGKAVFASPDKPIILTRRIRQGFVAEQSEWRVRPRILLLHAPAAQDLPEDLIKAHIEALSDALRPWSASGRPLEEGLLVVRQVIGPADIGTALRRPASDGGAAHPCEGPCFSHVHVLAHGKSERDPVTDATRWGLRLGDENRSATSAEEIGRQFRDAETQPTVVTLAVCDAGNPGNSWSPKNSLAQELHMTGLPVVLAPQMPLTQHGSKVMARDFYTPLLEGCDVRLALHQVRLALVEDDEAGYDWASLTAYVQLPEGYVSYLREVGVQWEMERLKAARKRLVQAESKGATEGELRDIEQELTSRVSSLTERFEAIPVGLRDLHSECQGVMASAQKRYAEFNYRVARRGDPVDPRRTTMSRVALEAADETYAAAFRSNRQNHWLGVQSLSLSAVLRGSIDAATWDFTHLSAQFDTLGASDLDGRPGAYWAHGTLAELWVLAVLLGRDHEPASCVVEAQRSLDDLIAAVRTEDTKTDAAFAIESTRDQLSRYRDWWISANGYFPGVSDLSDQAGLLIEHLDRSADQRKRKGCKTTTF